MTGYDSWKTAYPPSWDAKCEECGLTDCECEYDKDESFTEEPK